MREVEPRPDAIQRLERECDLDEIGVAGALPHAVDGSLHPGGACLHRRHGRSGREAEVVVAVPVHGHLVVEALHDLVDEERGSLRRGDAERVDDHDLLRARLDGALVDPADELEVGARGVDAEERDADPLFDSKRDSGANSLEHRLARDTERRELAVRDRALDHRGLQSELDQRFDVRSHRAREAPDLRIELGLEDQRDGARVVGGHPREAGLDAVDTGNRERGCNL